MASVPTSRKRKAFAPEPALKDEQLLSANALEMLSEDEQDEEPESDDGDYEAFPEIDAASDTEDEEDEEQDGDEDGEEEDYSSDASGSDKRLPIFPKAKVVISDITGEPKKVYPEIEPDYDSDSSTEDVSTSSASASTNALRYSPHTGP
jgi:ribosome biogenesis protein ERB1